MTLLVACKPYVATHSLGLISLRRDKESFNIMCFVSRRTKMKGKPCVVTRIKFVIGQKARRIFDQSRVGTKLYKMKRLFDILCTVLLLALTACQQEEPLVEPETGPKPSGPEFTARVEAFGAGEQAGEETQTKTALANDNSVVWSAGDQIAVFQGASEADRYVINEDYVGVDHGLFEIVEMAGGTQSFQSNVAIYPYEEGLSCTKLTGNEGSYQVAGVTIPATQNYSADSFADDSFPMVAVTDNLNDYTLNFKNLCGALKLQLKGTAKVKTIELRGNDNEPLSGDATVTAYSDGSAPMVTMSSDASPIVTLDCGDGVQLNETTATDFLLAIPPTVFEKGFTVTVTTIDGGVAQLETAKSNAVQRSYVHVMPETTIGYTPHVELGALSTLGVWARNFYGKQYYRTPRYMKVTGANVQVTVAESCDVRVCQYDEDFGFIKIIDFTSVNAGEAKGFKLDAACEYIRLVFRKNSSLTEFELPEVHVQGVEQQEYFEPRPSDEGYQKILAHVEVDGEILPDYGVVCLPETYSNVGEPTRLIIFCHGAAVNYPSSVSRFVDSDLNPEYWLKEGYAIMDVEGNPYDNTNEHFYIPAAKKSYEAAYNWVVNTYNIRKDGVYLGGRSMGGGMCFDILQSSIPVIAACPVVPACNTLWHWNYCSAERKTFCSEKAGFTGTPPAWTSNKKMTDEEYQYLYDNFDKMMECSPIWRGIVDLPSKDELFSVGRVSANTAYDKDEYEFFSQLSYWAKAPVKIFTCYEDTTVPYRRNAELMYNMMVNAGMECELSLVHTDAATPHRYEQQDSNANITVTTRYGETLSAPWVYVDMLKFWRKYTVE